MRECPSFEMSKGQWPHFHLNGFLLTCEFLKSILLRLSIANQFCCWTTSIGSCFYLDRYYLSVEWCSLAWVEKSRKNDKGQTVASGLRERGWVSS